MNAENEFRKTYSKRKEIHEGKMVGGPCDFNVSPQFPYVWFWGLGTFGDWQYFAFSLCIAFYLWKSFPLFVSIMIEIQFIQCALKVFSFRLEWEGFQIFNLKLINCLQIEFIFKLIHEEEFTCLVFPHINYFLH